MMICYALFIPKNNGIIFNMHLIEDGFYKFSTKITEEKNSRTRLKFLG
jgi:hypothetical protein